MKKWVVKQQAYLGQVLEESLPNAAEWAERQGQSLVTAYNLSQVSLPAGLASAYSNSGVIEAGVVGFHTDDWPEFPPILTEMVRSLDTGVLLLSFCTLNWYILAAEGSV